MAELMTPPRRGFLQRLIGVAGLSAAAASPAPAPQSRAKTRGAKSAALVRPAAELQVAETIELRPHRRQLRSLAHRARSHAGSVQRRRTRHDHSHLVYHRGRRVRIT